MIKLLKEIKEYLNGERRLRCIMWMSVFPNIIYRAIVILVKIPTLLFCGPLIKWFSNYTEFQDRSIGALEYNDF